MRHEMLSFQNFFVIACGLKKHIVSQFFSLIQELTDVIALVNLAETY